PAGFDEAKSQAALVWKIVSVLDPIVGGPKIPWPRSLNCAWVAPVVPLLSSKLMPAQKVVLGRLNSADPGEKVNSWTSSAENVSGLKLNPVIKVPGPPPEPSD